MTRYHMSERGEMAPCKAEAGNCPLGGDHYESKEEAQAGIEARLAEEHDVNSGIRKNTKTSQTDDTEAAPSPNDDELDRARRVLGLTAPEVNMVKKLRDGKSVPDKKLDTFIAEREISFDRHALPGRDDDEFQKNAADTLAYVKSERSKSNTPSTLHTVQSFDPSTETMFSNSKARSYAHIAGKALIREEGELKNAEAQRAEYNSRSDDSSAYSKEEMKFLKEANSRRIAKSTARLNGLIKETKWLSENDSQFAKTMTSAQKSAVRRYTPSDSEPGVYLGRIKSI